jgi:thiamine biosynthesis lipoprotein
VEGERLGHVLDPRTGLPVAAGVGVTVVTGDPMVADILATALLVMGPGEGGRWAADLEDAGVLWVVERDGRVQESWNTAFERYRVQPISDG